MITKKVNINSLFYILVRVEGLEPPRLAAPENLNLVRLPISPHPPLKYKKYFTIFYQKDIQVSRAKNAFFKKISSSISQHKFFIKRLFFNQVV